MMRSSILFLLPLMVCVNAYAQKHKPGKTKELTPNLCTYRRELIGNDSCYAFEYAIDDSLVSYYNNQYCWSDTLPDGIWIRYYKNGNIAERVPLKHGKFNGIFQRYYENGTLYEEQEYLAGKEGRRSAQWYFNGQKIFEVLPDTAENIARHSRWLSDGTLIEEGYYIYTVFDKTSPSYDIDSLVYLAQDRKPVVINGNGTIVSGYPNGSKRSESHYSGGKKSGTWSKWSAAGVRTESCSYEEGKLHGYYFRADTNGVLIVDGYYNNGHKDSTWTYYYRDGKVQSVSNYLYGRKHGLFQTWYPNGQVQNEWHIWNEGYYMGSYTGWYMNGRVRACEYYQFNRMEGLQEYYNKQGWKSFEAYYERNKRHWRRSYFLGIPLCKRYEKEYKPEKVRRNGHPPAGQDEIPWD